MNIIPFLHIFSSVFVLETITSDFCRTEPKWVVRVLPINDNLDFETFDNIEISRCIIIWNILLKKNDSHVSKKWFQRYSSIISYRITNLRLKKSHLQDKWYFFLQSFLNLSIPFDRLRPYSCSHASNNKL